MEREQKRLEVTQLHKTLDTAKSAVVLGFTELAADRDTLFRKQIRDHKAQYRVAKNTLLRLAAKETAFNSLSGHFKNSSAIVVTEQDAAGMVTTIHNFLKENPKVSFKGAILDGKEVTFDEFKMIAGLPSREILIGKLLYLMQYPISSIAAVLAAVEKQKEGAI